MPRRRKRRRSVGFLNKAISVLVPVLAVCVVLAAFVVEYGGGQGTLPTWDELYERLGIESSAPDRDLIASGDTSVSFLDVGQGDAVLICQDGEFCLIDAGTVESEESLLRSLESAGVEKLTYVVMTHPHADHAGGMAAVLETFPTETLILPQLEGLNEESATLERTLDAAQQYGTDTVEASTGDKYVLGTGQLEVLLAPTPEEAGDNLNNLSLCLRFTAGSFSFIDTGDAEEEVEEQLLERYWFGLDADLLKAGHHGSNTSNTEEFLAAVRPEIVVASCGLDNDYGHPHAEVVERIQNIGAEFYRTDLDGTVTVVLRDGTMQVDGTAWDNQEADQAA